MISELVVPSERARCRSFCRSSGSSRTDSTLAAAEPRGTAAFGAPRDQLIYVVARFGLGGQGLDLRVSDRLTGLSVAVGAVLCRGRSSLLNWARMGMAWIASWVLSMVVRITTQEIAGAIRSDDQPTIGVFASVFDSKCMVDSVMDVCTIDSVLTGRVVDLRRRA